MNGISVSQIRGGVVEWLLVRPNECETKKVGQSYSAWGILTWNLRKAKDVILKLHE